MKDVIEKLKRNKVKFSSLSPEEQEVLEGIPESYLIVLDSKTREFVEKKGGDFIASRIYRIDYNYKDEDALPMELLSDVSIVRHGNGMQIVACGIGRCHGCSLVTPIEKTEDEAWSAYETFLHSLM